MIYKISKKQMIEELITYIREEIGEFNQEIFPLTEFENDLGITGDDGIELIVKIAKKYEIDISEFEFNKYFHPEPYLFIKYNELEPLTIQHIVNAILSKKLI